MTTGQPSSIPPRSGRARPWLWALGALLLAGVAVWIWRARGVDGAGGHGPASAASAGGKESGSGGAGGQGGGGRRFGGANRVQPVSIALARRQDVHVAISALGTIGASNTAVVHAQVGGVLQSLGFKEGAEVRAGQVLAQIDPRAFQAALGQAQGVLARDQAQLDNARIDAARYRDLVAKDAAPKQQADTQQALVRQLEGTVKTDQAAVDTARLQLSYARVTAPIAGRAGLKQVDVGNLVQPGDAGGLVSITQTHPATLVFAVPSSYVRQIAGRLKSNVALPVEALDRDGKTPLAGGQVATMDNAIDPATDTIKVKALFPNLDDMLYPNQSVTVRLQVDTLAGALTVPQAAVLRGAQGFYVYVVDEGNKVAMRPVVPGPAENDWTSVTGSLRAGERVVIDGVDRLRDGAQVEVIAADPQARQGASAPASSAHGRHGGQGRRVPKAAS